MIEIFEKYTNNELSREEILQFEKRLSDDVAFRSAFDEYQKTIAGVEGYHLRRYLQDQAAIPGNDTGAFRKRNRWMYATITLLIAVVIVFLLLRSGDEEQAYSPDAAASFFKPDPGLPTTMDAAGSDPFLNAMVDYRMGSYEECIEQWTALYSKNPGNDTLAYFLGNAYQAIERDVKAKIYYESLLDSPTSVFYGQALFRLAILEAKNGNIERAVHYAERSNHPEARDLLELLDR